MSHQTTFIRYGGWLPSPSVHKSFLRAHIQRARRRLSDRAPIKYISAVQAFKDAIDGDPWMKGQFDLIFLQLPAKYPIPGDIQITNFDELVTVLDHILQSAPPFHVPKVDDEPVGPGEPIGVPIYVIFDLLSNTDAAHDLFRLPKFNTELKKLLDSWGDYLKNPESDSNAVFNTGPEGWFSEASLNKLETNLRDMSFDQTYAIPDPSAPNKGFVSWDAFFTRLFKHGVRPIGSYDNLQSDVPVICSACESTVYRITHNVSSHDQFWLKGQAYSLYDMLNRDKDRAQRFAGGTVYQAFLSPFDYHRWHAPFDGVIEKIDVVLGTYYAVLPDKGAPIDDPDFPAGAPYGALIRSQSWITTAATRALIYIRSLNPAIGLVCFIGVGMCEVSTCDVTVKVGQEVKTGDELGMFHFGGSTHALIFEPNCHVAFLPKLQKDTHVWVNSIIGVVLPNEGKGQ